ncbi:MAG: site-2 protease family protein [Candidatus Magasanikbacteria bacterium]
MNIAYQALFYFIFVVPSAIIHEYAHGWMANELGDPTAKHRGRLTLDPRAHIDMMGTILMPLFLLLVSGGNFLFAYAKPVPINHRNLNDQKWGPMWVALAGPLSNFALAAVFGLIIQIFPASSAMVQPLLIIVFVNVLLGVFNMVPIPPLDGSKVLFAFLPASYKEIEIKLRRYKFLILIIFLLFGFELIIPVIRYLTSLFTGGMVLF